MSSIRGMCFSILDIYEFNVSAHNENKAYHKGVPSAYSFNAIELVNI